MPTPPSASLRLWRRYRHRPPKSPIRTLAPMIILQMPFTRQCKISSGNCPRHSCRPSSKPDDSAGLLSILTRCPQPEYVIVFSGVRLFFFSSARTRQNKERKGMYQFSISIQRRSRKFNVGPKIHMHRKPYHHVLRRLLVASLSFLFCSWLLSRPSSTPRSYEIVLSNASLNIANVGNHTGPVL